jgi:hypothetical protein
MFKISKILAISAFSCAVALSGCASIPRESSRPVTASELVNSANEAWGVHCPTIRDLGFSIARAQITLQGKTTDQVSGSLGLLVLKSSASRSASTGQALSIGLVPRQILATGGERSNLSKALDKAFGAIVEVAEFANLQPDEDLLQIRVVRASVGFDLVETASGGVGVSLGELSVGGTAGRTTSGAHSMEFELQKADAGTGGGTAGCGVP